MLYWHIFGLKRDYSNQFELILVFFECLKNIYYLLEINQIALNDRKESIASIQASQIQQ